MESNKKGGVGLALCFRQKKQKKRNFLFCLPKGKKKRNNLLSFGRIINKKKPGFLCGIFAFFL